MSRTRRASVVAAFAYLQFALSILVGIALVPFILRQIGIGLYGYWLASGEVLAYAAMADLGVLGVVPWMIAQADGRGDRDGIRRLLSTGFTAGLVVSCVYLLLVVILWRLAPAVLNLGPEERALIAGPLTIIASFTAIVLPLRVANSALVGLQDVRFYGFMSTAGWAINVIVTVVLLWKGYGLYALAFGSSLPGVVGVIASTLRLRRIAPDLTTGWVRPSGGDVARLFREGLGAWLAAWGWRLSAATDAIVLAALGSPFAITQLAMTSKLGGMFANMAWVPGDSGLVGLAQLHGEDRPERLKAAVTALFRVYLSLASVGVCVVLAANPSFVRAWVGEPLFAGFTVNAVLAGIVIASTITHGLGTITSVLGHRMHVGIATLVSGGVQVALAVFLGRRLGIIGVPLAALTAHLVLLAPMLLPSLKDRTGVGIAALRRGVIVPWAIRAVPAMAACALLGEVVWRWPVPLWVAAMIGGAIGLASLWLMRRLILDYEPVANVIRARLATVRLDALLPAARLDS